MADRHQLYILNIPSSQAPYNVITYSIVGEDKAPNYFTIDSDNGQIRLRSSLLQDQDLSYRVSCGCFFCLVIILLVIYLLMKTYFQIV